ncbi:hypothetical protein Hdeb2414_s0003g00112701 [Helianthus debilis subsp. tardiflorus]
MEDEGRKTPKCPCVKNSASATVAAGTNAEVTGGSVFMILVGRKAQVKGNLSSASLVEIPNSASASTANVDDASDIYYVYHLEDGYHMVTGIKYHQPRCIRLQN